MIKNAFIKLEIVSIIFFCNTLVLVSQDTIPLLEGIISIAPEWTYLSEDTNWYPVENAQVFWNSYGGRYAIHDEIYNENYYVLEASFSFFSQFLTDGYFVHKLDLLTGEPSWVRRNNYFSGNEYLESGFVGDFTILDDFTMRVNGFKSRIPLDSLAVGGIGYFVNSMNHQLDMADGSFISEQLDTSTLETRKYFHGGIQVKALSQDYSVKVNFQPSNIDSIGYNDINFYVIDPLGYESVEPNYSYSFDTGIGFDTFRLLTFPRGYIKFDESRAVAYFSTFEFSKGRQPTDVKMLFFDTEDPHNIHISNEVDAGQFVPDNQIYDTNDPKITPMNNKICLWQKAEFVSGDCYTWMNIYNQSGELLHHIDRLNLGGEDINRIYGITSYDGNDYLLGETLSDTDNSNATGINYYIFHIDNDGNTNIISKFSKNEGYSDHYLQFQKLHLLPNFDLLMYAYATYPYASAFTNFSGVYRFSAEELGITTHIIDQDENTDDKYTISPNPASSYISILGDVRNVQDIYIYEEDGKLSQSVVLIEDKIDVSHLTFGMYYLKIVEPSGRVYTLPFIKI